MYTSIWNIFLCLNTPVTYICMSITQKSFFALLLMSNLCFGQSNYYVSPTGNNTASGSVNTPWKTIQYGLGKLNTNDTLNVFTGIYTEKINIPKNGIYLRNYAGNKPVIDATGITVQNPIVSISSKSNVTVTGFELKNNIQKDAQGILVDGAGANITIKNCIVHDIHFSSNVNAAVNANTNAQGIIVYGSNATTAITNLIISNNELYNCRLGYSEGLAVNGNVDGFLVADNQVHDLTNIGIDVIGHEGTSSNAANDQARNGTVRNNTIHHCISLYATSGGLYVDGGKNVVLEKNTSYHNGYGIEVGCENGGTTTDAIIVRENLFYDNQVAAIALGGYDYPTSGKVTNSAILSNTCYFNDYSNSGNGELYLSYSEGTRIENNIFYTTTKNKLAYAELTQPQLAFNFNTFYCAAGTNSLSADWNGKTYNTYAAFISGTVSNTGSIFANPAFVSASITTPDFHLPATSPSVNTGNAAYAVGSGETDFYNQPRVSSGRVDMGAIEYAAVVTGIEDASINTLQGMVYPNPGSGLMNYKITEGSHQIIVYNAFGQIIFDETRTMISPVNLQYLNTGMYVLEILQNEQKYIQKLIVQ